ncbi:MAG: hypothetical protein RI894_2355, partial [Bacteroidota bacterium]
MEQFKALGLSDVTLAALAKKGYEVPTPIQAATIPLLLEGKHDVIGQAQTGTGKTAAFGLPILERLIDGAHHVQAIILTPTRELAIQVSEEIYSFRGERNLRILTVYGGSPIGPQIASLRKGVDVVVGTPGRIIDMLERGALKCDKLSYFVLDEADEMLNMGFADDIEAIFAQTNAEKSVLLFSATMPERIAKLAASYMRDYKIVRVAKQNLITDLTEQIYFEVYERDKLETLCRILDRETDFYGFVFCNTKADVDALTAHLNDRGYRAEALHGDIAQAQREKILNKFKKKQATVLLATDVAARGIDVSNLSHVINYGLPNDPESYVHRIGRTGRAGNKGIAISLVSPNDMRKLALIKRIAKAEIKREKVPAISEVLRSKRTKIYNSIIDVMQNNECTDYITIAANLLEKGEAPMIVASILQYTFQDALRPENYNDIKEVTQRTDRPTNERFDRNDRSSSSNSRFDRNDRSSSSTNSRFERNDRTPQGQSREFREFAGSSGGSMVDLFMAMGRNEKASPRDIAEFIETQTGVRGRNVSNIRVF